MDAKRFVMGTLVGGVTVLAAGYLIFAMTPFRDFYAYAMTSGSATGVQRDAPLFWAMALGALSYGALVTFAIATRAGAVSIGAGLRIGAIVGFLLWFTANFMFYGISNVGNLTSTILDSLLELVPGAIAGGVIAAVIGKAR